MRQSAFWTFFVVGAILFMHSCTDPTSIGATLLEEDRTLLEFFDTVGVEASTVAGQAVTTYAPLGGSFFSGYPTGRMSDPIFGDTEATVYFQVLPIFADSLSIEGTIEIDSVILAVPFNRNNFYGLFNQEFGLQVRQIAEQVNNDITYNSDQSFLLEDRPLVDDFRFRPIDDTVSYVDWFNAGTPDTVTESQLRIPLSVGLGAQLLSFNDLVVEDRNLFWQQFPGIALIPTTTNKGLSSFNLIDSDAGIYIYYHVDTINYQYQLNINNNQTNNNLRYVQYEHDFNGTIVGDALDQSNPTQDSLFFMQGMAGPSIRLSFPFIEQLRQQNFVINKAELEIRVATIANDSSLVFTPSDEILLATKNEEGEFVPIFDYLATSINREERFGGVLTSEPGEPEFFSMNLSSHMQDILDGRVENELYIILAPTKAANPSRIMIYGPNHPKYPIKLRLAGTVLE